MITIFIDNINFPGGPVGFNTAVEYSLPSPIVSNAAYISGNVFADALLVSANLTNSFSRHLMYRITHLQLPGLEM